MHNPESQQRQRGLVATTGRAFVAAGDAVGLWVERQRPRAEVAAAGGVMLLVGIGIGAWGVLAIPTWFGFSMLMCN